MKNFLYILLFILTPLTTSLHADINLVSDQQIKYLVNQARFFAQHGISQEEILRIFKQSLTHEELCNDEPEEQESNEYFVMDLIFIILCCTLNIVALAAQISLLKSESNLATSRLNLIREQQRFNAEIANFNEENHTAFNQEIAQAQERLRQAEQRVGQVQQRVGPEEFSDFQRLISEPNLYRSDIIGEHQLERRAQQYEVENELREARNLLRQAEARATDYQNLQHQLRFENLNIPIQARQIPFNQQDRFLLPIPMDPFPFYLS